MKKKVITPETPLSEIGTETWQGRIYPVLASYCQENDGRHCCDLSKVWCDYCWCWHTHGRGDGHRHAHCWGRSPRQFRPYAKHGYILQEVGPWTPGLAKYGKGREFRLQRPFWCKSCHADLPAVYRDTACPRCGRPTTAQKRTHPGRLPNDLLTEARQPGFDVPLQAQSF
jgi:hypothetical protein